jgi:hypothetical protein
MSNNVWSPFEGFLERKELKRVFLKKERTAKWREKKKKKEKEEKEKKKNWFGWWGLSCGWVGW